MSEANCGISVHEVTQVRVSDSEGNAMNQGDTIVPRIDTEDILCVFKRNRERILHHRDVRGRNQKPLPCQEHQEIQSSKERIRRCSR